MFHIANAHSCVPLSLQIWLEQLVNDKKIFHLFAVAVLYGSKVIKIKY